MKVLFYLFHPSHDPNVLLVSCYVSFGIYYIKFTFVLNSIFSLFTIFFKTCLLILVRMFIWWLMMKKRAIFNSIEVSYYLRIQFNWSFILLEGPTYKVNSWFWWFKSIIKINLNGWGDKKENSSNQNPKFLI